ncbi:DNA primase [Homoserinibacter sp. YIM 151385]|uniref:DNA primase n=1 Tax=Homoserinibacter sp. YIM 151385 TaxID=2985506 RepID=UPI0022EFD8D9|nr:DNA primase [Homoserinibacter sp. YIM 151385]WBU38430.1 DNA primase [Homoserinibacter sp. YIM 151385]
MPGLIRRSDIDEVRSRTNIADIVGDYVTLKSAGVGSLKGLCPFHDERSPSFHVRPQVGFYHCFGCGEGGDVYTFLQRMDHVSFQEAVERLAGRIGLELHYEDGGQANSDHGVRARLLAANAAAETFFRERLAAPDAQPGREFLGQRGFDPQAAARFGVGFAPKSFDALGSALKAQGFTQEELIAAGLLSTNERGNAYDRFRGRLIWPIRDVTGATIGFGARKLLSDDEDRGPKYLNTPETAIYHKSQVLYGLDLARRDIARGKQVVVVEGYTDVMACHLAGITTAVATCGTSFGVDHIKVVRRVLGDTDNRDTSATGEVIFTFDPDEAGQKAASRAFAEEQRFAAQTFVAVAPEGLDPCDLRLKRGDDAVRRLVSGRKPMFEFMIRRQLQTHDLETVEGRVAALRAAAPIVAGIRDQALGVGYVRSLAGWLGMDPGEVGRAVQSARARTAKTVDPRVDVRPESGLEPPEGAPPSAGPSLMDLPTDPSTRLERDSLMVLLQHPVAVGAELVAAASRAGFGNHALSVVRDAIAAHATEIERVDWVQAIADEVPRSYQALVTQLGVAPVPERGERIAAYARSLVTDLLDRDLLRRKAELLGSAQRAQSDGDAERARELYARSAVVEQERRRLRAE